MTDTPYTDTAKLSADALAKSALWLGILRDEFERNLAMTHNEYWAALMQVQDWCTSALCHYDRIYCREHGVR